MLLTGSIAVLASLLYFYASAIIWKNIQASTHNDIRPKIIKIIALAVALHAYTLSDTLWLDSSIFFHIGNGLSLVAILAAAILLVTHLNKPTETLGVFIYPLAALSTLIPLSIETSVELPIELGSHVLISIAAYSIMGIATAQAILYGVQERNFKAKRLSKLMKALPPLQVMESTLLQLVKIGFIFLTFALISGAFFVENLFEQHLIHKTFFAIAAWLVYGFFLFGQAKYGWRGQTAAQYTIWAYFLLILSYIGTTIIIEYVLV
ncbi:cytochrome C assembly family protein [Thiomicrorhabdus lithotrophica]|uniref:Cytochrome c biogenesis protein CcsA n=1 Tax=Thiomicrorhabdus lithotrophica TaxID=2949997 RepID=A0ABY8CB98_9GAMM|nr:cytochrome c biogenesis protein CcsA [Thiomicrorhabdus lithotrophica]WEJ63214.1 cytochrome c biogenesis protein CcsA [Thiomicrorhabdus lithotrophica]